MYEWCEDRKADYITEVIIDQKGPTNKSHVLRGRSFINYISQGHFCNRYSCLHAFQKFVFLLGENQMIDG